MEAEVMANSLSHGHPHQAGELTAGMMVDEILRPEKASMNLLVQTDTTNMGRVRTYSTCNMDDVLDLDVEGSTLNSMMLNEEVMDQSMDSWTADISSVIEFSSIDINENSSNKHSNRRHHDSSHQHSSNTSLLYSHHKPNSRSLLKMTGISNINSISSNATSSATTTNLSEEDFSLLKASSPSLNLLNTSSIVPNGGCNGRTSSTKQMGDDSAEFNVLHLDEHAITDLESFPLFSMEDDVGSLLEQFEEVSQGGAVEEAEEAMAHEVYDLSKETVNIHRVSSDSSLSHLVSAQDQAFHSNLRVADIKEESPEVVRLLKAKSALPKLNKNPGLNTGASSKNMPNPEVLKKIKGNNKRKSTILLSDALPSRPDRLCKGNKQQSLPVYASRKLRKLLGHMTEDSNSDIGEREDTVRPAGQDRTKTSSSSAIVEDIGHISNKGLDSSCGASSISPNTPETITAPSTPAPPSGANSGYSTPDVQPKRKISLSAYKRRLSAVQKGGSSSGSNTPIDSGRSTPVKEFEDNTQIIINTVKARLTAQMDGTGFKPISMGEKANKQETSEGNNQYYSVVMDHDYCQMGATKPYNRKEARPQDKVADTWGVDPHGSNRNHNRANTKKTLSRCSSLPVMSVQKCEEQNDSRTSSRINSSKGLSSSKVKLPDLLAHPPPYPIRPKQPPPPTSPVKQTPPVEVIPVIKAEDESKPVRVEVLKEEPVLSKELNTDVKKEEEERKEEEAELEDSQQSSMLKDLLLSPELEKEMKEQAKVDREESMRRMSAKSASLSPDADHMNCFEDEQFKESTEVMDTDLMEDKEEGEEGKGVLSEEEGKEKGVPSEEEGEEGNQATNTDTTRVEDIHQQQADDNRFSKFESEKENTLVCNGETVAQPKGTNPRKHHNKRKYRKNNRSKSPQINKEPYFDKLPNYCTALAHKNELEAHKNFTAVNKLANSGLPTHDRDPSPERDAAMFNKVPAYFQCFTNSTRYDNMPERESPALDEDEESYVWVEKVAHTEKSNSSSRATSPGLIINTGATVSRANSRSRPSSRTSLHVRADSQSPTNVTSYSSVNEKNLVKKNSGGGQRNRKRSYSSSSRSPSRSHSRSRSRSPSRSYSRSRSRSCSRSHRSRSPGYRRHNKRRKYSRSRSRSTSWDRWKAEQRKRREEEKRTKMKQRKIMYVGGIPDSYTKRDLRKSFDKFGKIEDVSLHFREHGDNYGFVTFSYRCDAFAAIEMGKSMPGCKNFDLCFGGRRLFCKTRYEDLDGNMEEEEEMAPVLSQPTQSLDFDKLLRQALKKKL